MKRKILLSILTILILSAVFISCKKTKKEETGAAPGKEAETTIETRQTTTDPGHKIRRKLPNKRNLKKTLKRNAIQIKHLDMKQKGTIKTMPATEKSEKEIEPKKKEATKKEAVKKEKAKKEVKKETKKEIKKEVKKEVKDKPSEKTE